ncbi:MAG: phosphoribosylaminoimidazolesuccinocarboxamide synthase [Nitrospirota bacterium]|nr:MAG: phosphoribosylaminoimidazolesuccinocarboxamide synthase [Nitrospirota bacterium]
MDVVLKTEFNDLDLVRRGKVRDIYDLGDYLLMVITDRVSAFDVILPNGIPGKGRVLTAISTFWFDQIRDIIENHIVSVNVDDYPDECVPYRSQLEGRSMLVRKAKPLPVECIVRGYISGSGWKAYQEDGKVCGIELPAGLKESDRLPEPIFTPSTKADEGHDINISYEEAVKLLGDDVADRVRNYSLHIYRKASEIAEKKGIIIADTKFEFGIYDDELIIIDEALTPDSSRFWSMKDYAPGKSQDSFDKQIVRDYLLTLDWDKTHPGPELPDDIVSKTAGRYDEILNILTS